MYVISNYSSPHLLLYFKSFVSVIPGALLPCHFCVGLCILGIVNLSLHLKKLRTDDIRNFNEDLNLDRKFS